MQHLCMQCEDPVKELGFIITSVPSRDPVCVWAEYLNKGWGCELNPWKQYWIGGFTDFSFCRSVGLTSFAELRRAIAKLG